MCFIKHESVDRFIISVKFSSEIPAQFDFYWLRLFLTEYETFNFIISIVSYEFILINNQAVFLWHNFMTKLI